MLYGWIWIITIVLLLTYIFFRSVKRDEERIKRKKVSWKYILVDDFLGSFKDDLGLAITGVILGFAIISLITALVYLPTHMALRYFFDTRETETHQQNIASLNGKDVLSGSFFLGCGSINQTDYYFYFARCSDGSYVKDRVRTYYTYIYEDENSNPYLSWKRVRRTCPSWLKIGINDSYLCSTRRYDLHVPENTIIKEYVLR